MGINESHSLKGIIDPKLKPRPAEPRAYPLSISQSCLERSQNLGNHAQWIRASKYEIILTYFCLYL